MVELLKFEYYRLIKSKMVWIILGVMAFLPVLPVILFSILVKFDGGDVKFSADEAKLLTWFVISYFYKWVPMVMALFVPLFVGRDYRDGFIRNKLTAGHTRFEIFTASVVTKVTYAIALCVAYVLVGLLAVAISPLDVNVNGGEMFLRASTLMLSAVATTVLFTSLTMIIKNRAVPVILSVLFVMSFSLAGLLATNFSYDHRMIREYSKLRQDMLEEQIGEDYEDDFDEDKYFNVGWYIGHPISVATNTALQDEFLPGLNLISINEDSLTYKEKIARHPFNSMGLSMITNDGFGYYMDQHQLKKIHGAYVSVSKAELQYNIKSVVWMAVYFAGGYMIFRRKNVF